MTRHHGVRARLDGDADRPSPPPATAADPIPPCATTPRQDCLAAAEAERDHAIARLAEREARLRLAVEAARLATWEFDVATGRASRTGCPDEAFAAPGDPAGFRFDDWLDHIHPEDRETVRRRFDALVAGTAARFAAEFRVRRRGGEGGWAWLASSGAAIARDPGTGRALRIAGVAQDITDRREGEARRALLAREVDHRARNLLAVVQSLLRLTPREDAARFAAAVEGRVAALARAHGLLADSGWTGTGLRAIAEREMAGAPPDAVTLDGPALTLAAAAVQPLALVLHELAANAARHGALSVPGGRVALRWWREPEAGRVRLLWLEEGGPPVAAPPARRGFGARLIEAQVRGQLGGTAVLGWEPTGLRCAIALPAERLLAACGTPAPPAVGAAAAQ